MKKIFTLVLCLLMVLTLVACGGKENPEEGNETTKQEDNVTSEIQENNTTEEIENEEKGFDKNWASEEFEILIPEPPFAYEVEVEDRGSEITFEIKATNGGQDGDVTHEKILTYCEDIKNAGFSESIREGEIGERYGRTCYEFYAENGKRSCVNLIDDGGGVVIFAIIYVEER